MHVQKTRFRFWACLLQHKHMKRTVVKLTLPNVALEVLQGKKTLQFKHNYHMCTLVVRYVFLIFKGSRMGRSDKVQVLFGV